MENIFDGIQRPLQLIYDQAGHSPFVPLGVDVAALDRYDPALPQYPDYLTHTNRPWLQAKMEITVFKWNRVSVLHVSDESGPLITRIKQLLVIYIVP
jgi:hypothetical protein